MDTSLAFRSIALRDLEFLLTVNRGGLNSAQFMQGPPIVPEPAMFKVWPNDPWLKVGRLGRLFNRSAPSSQVILAVRI